MKNWKFEIKFSGLTAFVIRPDKKGGRVFLMRAFDLPRKKHEPELRFDQRDVAVSPWKIPFPGSVIQDPLPSDRKKWMLKFLDLHFLPAPDVTLTQKFVLDQSVDDYLLSFEKIFKDASVIHPDSFSPSPSENLVAIRVPLRHGTLKTTKLAFEQFNHVVDCQFAPKGRPNQPISHKQKCAIELALEFTVADGPLTLLGVPFSPSLSSGIAFEPRPGEPGVIVELENRPLGIEKSVLVPGIGKEKDEDFALHYNLSHKNHPEDDRIVPLFDPIPREDGKEIGSENCINGRFADDPRA